MSQETERLETGLSEISRFYPRYLGPREISRPRTEISRPPRYLGPDQDIYLSGQDDTGHVPGRPQAGDDLARVSWSAYPGTHGGLGS